MEIKLQDICPQRGCSDMYQWACKKIAENYAKELFIKHNERDTEQKQYSVCVCTCNQVFSFDKKDYNYSQID
jgi:hypothetical protein